MSRIYIDLCTLVSIKQVFQYRITLKYLVSGQLEEAIRLGHGWVSFTLSLAIFTSVQCQMHAAVCRVQTWPDIYENCVLDTRSGIWTLKL